MNKQPTYTPTLQNLINKLTAQGFVLNAKTFSDYNPDNENDVSRPPIGLWHLLYQNLVLNAQVGLPITDAELDPNVSGSRAVLTGRASLLGMQDVMITATFQDPLPSDVTVLKPKCIPRALTLVIEIPLWNIGASFPDLKETWFAHLAFTQLPVLIFSSYAHRDPVRNVELEAGLNFYGMLDLLGSPQPEFNRVVQFIGQHTPQMLVGPIQWVSLGAEQLALPDLALRSPDGNPYQHQFPNFPPLTIEVHLAMVPSGWEDSPPRLVAQICLTALLDVSRALYWTPGNLPFVGMITQNDTVVLSYEGPERKGPFIDLAVLGEILNNRDLIGALPEGLRSESFRLEQAGLTVTPDTIVACSLQVSTRQWSLVPDTFLILGPVQATLAFSPPGTISCMIMGRFIRSPGLLLSATNQDGFPYPFVISRDLTDHYLPVFLDLAKVFQLGDNLPPDIAQMETGYTLQDFVVTVESATSAKAITHLTMNNPWTLVDGQQQYAFKVVGTSITLEREVGRLSSGNISGDTTFIGAKVQIQLPLPAPSSHLLHIAVPTTQFLFPDLATTILGIKTGDIPDWLQPVGFAGGEMVVDYQALAFTDASHFTIPKSISLSDDSTLSNLSVMFSANAQTAHLCLIGTWTWDWVYPHAIYHGTVCNAYLGNTNSPFTQFQEDDLQQLEPIPRAKTIPPDNQQTPDTNGFSISVAYFGVGMLLAPCVLYLLWAGCFGLSETRSAAAKAAVLAKKIQDAAPPVRIPLAVIIAALVQVFGYDLPGTVKDMVAAALQPIPATDMATELTMDFPTLSANDCAAALLGGYRLSAQELTDALQTAGFLAPDVAPVIYKRYPQETDIAEKMALLLLNAYATLSVTTMAAALAATTPAIPYAPPAVAPVLYRHFPGETTTAERMAAILQGAYRTLTASTLVNALATLPYPVYASTQATIHRYPAQTATVLEVARLLFTAGYPALPILPVLRLNFPLATQTALDCAKVLHDANCPEAAARVSLLAVDFPPAVVDDALRLVYTERMTMMLLNNLLDVRTSHGGTAYFEITSALGDTINGQIVPFGSRYIVPAGPPPYSVKISEIDNSNADTVTGIASADVVATYILDSTSKDFYKLIVSNPGATDQ